LNKPENKWARDDVPGETHDCAIRDMDKARKVHFAKLKNMRSKDPNVKHDATFKFRSKKDPSQGFEVHG